MIRSRNAIRITAVRAVAALLFVTAALAVHAQGTDTPAAGGTLVIAASGDPGHLNPGITTGFEVHSIADSIFNGLVALDDNANPMPDLAVRWEISPDARVYTFHLAQDATWHDGERFTSADVKFTFEEVLLQYHSRTKAGLEGILESIATPDDHTVVFTFSEPYAPLLQRLNVTEAPILPEHIYGRVEDIQTADVNLQPVGTGPFVFHEYVIDDRVTLRRNANYFKDGLPYVDEVVFRIIPDANTQLLALEQGEVDFIWRVPGAEIERLQDDEDVQLYNLNSGPGGGFCVMTLTFNLDREIFQDLRARQAIAHAIDREQILEQVIFDQGQVATGPISSQMEFAYTDNVVMYAHDYDAAASLLDAAGYAPGADGTRFSMDFLHFPAFSKYGEVIRQNLANVGVAVELVPLDRSAFLPRVFGERDFDTNIISYCNNTDPTIGVSRMYVSTNIGNIPFSNGAGYVNPEIDRLFDEAAKAADQDERGEIYAEIQRILTEELPYWWLVETTFTAGAGSNVTGLKAWSGHVAEEAWFEGGGN